jgi:hypothetical protein
VGSWPFPCALLHSPSGLDWAGNPEPVALSASRLLGFSGTRFLTRRVKYGRLPDGRVGEGRRPGRPRFMSACYWVGAFLHAHGAMRVEPVGPATADVQNVLSRVFRRFLAHRSRVSEPSAGRDWGKPVAGRVHAAHRVKDDVTSWFASDRIVRLVSTRWCGHDSAARETG